MCVGLLTFSLSFLASNTAFKMKFHSASFWGALGGAFLLACSSNGASFVEAYNEQEAAAFMERFNIPKNHIPLEWASTGSDIRVTEVGGVKYKWKPSKDIVELFLAPRRQLCPSGSPLLLVCAFCFVFKEKKCCVAFVYLQKRALWELRLATHSCGTGRREVIALDLTRE